MTTVDNMSLAIYSDMYKSAYGFRPRGPHGFTSQEQLEAEMNYLSEIIQENIKREDAEHARADARFDTFISDLMNDHNISQKDAIRWALQGEGCDFSHSQEVEYHLWELGLSYNKIMEYSKIVDEFVTREW